MFFYYIYQYCIFFPVNIILLFIFSICAITLSFIPFYGENIAIFIMRIPAFIVIKTIPVSYDVKGIKNISKKQSYVILANHTSIMDGIIIILIFGTKIRPVMKKGIRNVPLFGFTLSRMGYITINRKNRESAIKTINSAKNKLKNGKSILFFPEGTRNTHSELSAFKKGAFHIALEMQLPILPVTICGAAKISPKGKIGFFPGKVKIILHKPIKIDPFTKDNIGVLINLSYNTVKSGLNN